MSMLVTIKLTLLCCYIAFGMDAGPLHLLDRRICEELNDPMDFEGQGDLVLKEMIAYYSNLNDIFNNLKYDDKRGLEMLDTLEKDGGPRLTSMNLNGESIKAAYKWQDSDFEMMTDMLTAIKGVPKYKPPAQNYTIFELDEKISKLILKPDSNEKDALFNLVYKLHLDMLHIHEVVHFNISDPATIKLSQELVDRNGLQLFKMQVDEDKLKGDYNYKDHEVYHIVDLITNCIRLYNCSEPVIKGGDCEFTLAAKQFDKLKI